MWTKSLEVIKRSTFYVGTFVDSSLKAHQIYS